MDRQTIPPVRTLAIDHRAVNLWPPDPCMYQREMAHFVAAVEAGEPTCNPIESAAELLNHAFDIAGI